MKRRSTPIQCDGNGVHVGVRLPEMLVAEIDAIADAASARNLVPAGTDAFTAERVTRSDVIRMLLADGLREAKAILGLPEGKDGAQ